MHTQTLYQKAIKFAGEKHSNQIVPGTNSNYLLHLSNVAMEILIASYNTKNFELGFAIQVGLLHDILEDTDTTFNELRSLYGKEIADAVSALSKNSDLPKKRQMQDSLNRVKKLQPEVWAIKLRFSDTCTYDTLGDCSAHVLVWLRGNDNNVSHYAFSNN